MGVPQDYLDRVYAGVLGKIVGVYLGRPFEGWKHERIERELGEIRYYVNAKLSKPLIVTDDDISGTFTFVRALSDYGSVRSISSRQIGQTWLNYIVEGRTVFWWGGMGESTEHTAYLRLKGGIDAPQSGSTLTNGATVAEQIGAQIFIDGWAMAAPGDPVLAVELAGKAARVSHDGEAVYAAQFIAAMESAAFVESDLTRLVDGALKHIPRDCTIRRVVDDVRKWRSVHDDWRTVRRLIEDSYGYHRYPGHVHVVPNFAIVMLSLLYGEDRFEEALMIANTSGWDTDCNSGNVGCLLGIKNGLAVFDDGPDWRGPVADRLYLPTADGGRAISDVLSEACRIETIGRALAGEKPVAPRKGGARFHFDLPGALQGFTAEVSSGNVGSVSVTNVEGHSEAGSRSLAVQFSGIAQGGGIRLSTPTFIPPEALDMVGYAMVAAPTLYSGQRVSLRVEADRGNGGSVKLRGFIAVYGADDKREIFCEPAQSLAAGEAVQLSWTVRDTGGYPIEEVGIELTSDIAAEGVVYLDWLTWDGAPTVSFKRPGGGGSLWRRAWVSACDRFDSMWSEAFRVSQDRGSGVLMTGCREWRDYLVSATLSTDMAAEIGIAARVQGLRRYYALVLTAAGKAELRKVLDGEGKLAEADFAWSLGGRPALSMEVVQNRIRGYVNGRLLFDVVDEENPLDGGGVALLCKEGCLATDEVRVAPPSSVPSMSDAG